ncbi:hypothetical protein ABZY06_35090 [Streptomyces sp. NPDC006540]
MNGAPGGQVVQADKTILQVSGRAAAVDEAAVARMHNLALAI